MKIFDYILQFFEMLLELVLGIISTLFWFIVAAGLILVVMWILSVIFRPT